MKGQTFYSSLYGPLTSLIMTRRLPYGGRPPSVKQSCNTYQVGIRTVQDVLRDMRDAGYISLKARRRAQVVWQPSQAHGEQMDLYILHTHRQMTDVLESMCLCLPPFCSGLCDLLQEKDIRHLYKMLPTLEDNKNLKRCRLLIRDFNVYLLQRYHNDIILGLYLTTFSYIEYPLLYHTGLFSSYHGTLKYDYEQLFAAYTDKNCRFVYDSYDYTIRCIIQRIREHAAQIQFCGNHRIPEAAPFLWQPKHSHDYVYTLVFQGIIRSIVCKTYADQQLLLPIEQLSRTHQVPYVTIHKVLKQLDDIGLAKTHNGLGTRIQLNKGVVQAHLEDNTTIRDAVKFIGAVQFITITIGRYCLEYFDQLLVLAPVMEERIKKGIMMASVSLMSY